MSELDGDEAARDEAGRDDGAKRRLWLMTLVRLAGYAVVILGMWIAGQSQGRGWQMALGLCAMGGGAALLLFGPRALSRRWKP